MADSTTMPTLAYFQWARPDAPNPKLAAPIDSDDTTLVFTSAPEDEDGNVITTAFLMGIKNSDSYVETIYVPVGALSVDGLTATGVVRGIDISGIDYTTGNSNFASSFDQDSPVFCNVTAVAASIMRDLLQGTNQMATGGTSFTIGTEPGASGETVTLYRTTTAGVRKGFFRWESGTGKTQYSDDGTTWVDNDDNTAGNLSLVSANDTTAGYLNGKLVAGANITLTENNDGGNETLTIAASSANPTVTTHATYTPAYLTGGNAPETNVAIWDSVSDGEFAITIDGVAREITGLDFTTPVTSMAEVAAVIQAGIRAVTGSTETCTWSGTEFVISSVDTTASSAITKTSTVAAPAGTDISGAGAGAYMDCDAGSTAAVTDKVLDPTADAGKVPALNANGNVDTDLLQEVIPTGGYTAKGEIVAGTAADTPGLLSVGSNGQVLVADSGESTGLNWATISKGEIVHSDFTQVVTTNSGADITLISYTVPANALGTSNAYRIVAFCSDIDGAGGGDTAYKLKYGSTVVATGTASGVNDQGKVEGYIQAAGGTGAQEGMVCGSAGGSSGFGVGAGTAAEDSTGALTLSLIINHVSTSGDVTFDGGYVEFIPGS